MVNSGSEKQNERITIVVACDDHYLIMLGALLKSIEKNHKTPELIDVYVIDDNVSSRNKRRLHQSIDEQMFTLHWIPIKDAVPKGMNFPLVHNSYPLNTYIRLFIPHFMPKHIKKVLFMDVDMLVLNDISNLWHIDIGDHIIGAVTDSITRFVGNLEGGGIANYEELGLHPETKYFNAGLQLINIPKWLENNVTEKIINCINDNRKYANMGDQYGLNVILCDKYFEIDPMWNYMANGDHPTPHLIHFIHRKPFYKSYFNNPSYQKLFYEYLSETKWKDARPIGESVRYLKKLSNVIQKLQLVFSKKAA
jgi:lipopolysaccharide biosynthesis glycosyltransferase